MPRLVSGARERLVTSLLCHGTADVDQIVGKDAEADPNASCRPRFLSASDQAVVNYADASLARGPPSLAVAEPSLFLLAPAFPASGQTIRLQTRFTPLTLTLASFLAE